MTVGIRTGSIVNVIGTPDFLFSFFSSIACLLESGNVGSRFPTISSEMYQGKVVINDVGSAIEELEKIKAEFSMLPPSSAVWDMENLRKTAPWGKDISAPITSMANYFVTSTGRDLIDMLLEVFEHANNKKLDATIEPI